MQGDQELLLRVCFLVRLCTTHRKVNGNVTKLGIIMDYSAEMVSQEYLYNKLCSPGGATLDENRLSTNRWLVHPQDHVERVTLNTGNRKRWHHKVRKLWQTNWSCSYCEAGIRVQVHAARFKTKIRVSHSVNMEQAKTMKVTICVYQPGQRIWYS